MQNVRDSLNEFAAGLHLEQEDLPGIFDSSLLDSALRLETAVGNSFSAAPAARVVALRHATKSLVEEPSPDAMAAVLHEFNGLIVELFSEVGSKSAACEWRLARQYSDIASHLAGPKPAENQGFRELPRMLAESRWMRGQFEELVGVCDLSLARTPVSRGFSKTAAKRWMTRANRKGEGQLCSALDHLQQGVEYRQRQVWLLRRADGEERSLPYLYVLAHGEIFPDFHISLSEQRLALEIAKLKGLALGLQLPEFAICFESAEWISNYAFSYLLPPSPADSPVRQGSQLSQVLASRLSRWYFCAYSHRLEPLEMAAAVLRIGRPLFYERVAAHALLEYSLLQGIAFSRASAPFYVDALAVLEREFHLLFDGYLLRLMYYPRLKTPQGWCDYLEALHALHYRNDEPEGLDAFRYAFLARRGLRSTLEILYRTVESHSALN